MSRDREQLGFEYAEPLPNQHQRRLSAAGKLAVFYLIVWAVACIAAVAIIVFGVRG